MKPFAARDQDSAAAETEGVVGYLPSLDPDQSRWTHEAASALAAAMPDMRVTIRPWPPSVGDCFHGAQWRFQPGEHWRAPAGASGETLAASLDQAEELLDQVEAATGLAVEFDRHGPAESTMAAISIVDVKGETVALLAPLSAPRPRRALGPSIVKLSFAAARLPLTEAERLGPGDLLILHKAAWQVAVEGADLSLDATLRFDPQGGSIAPGRIGNHLLEEPDMSQTAPPKDFMVPVMIGLPEVAVDRSALDALAQGGTLDIGPIAEGLNVTLSIGGRHLASGEIVTIGDRFAVLVADPFPISGDERPHSESDHTSIDPSDEQEAG